MLNPTMSLVEISGKDCKCQCSRRASEKKTILYYTKFTLPTVEGRPLSSCCEKHVWSAEIPVFCKIKKKEREGCKLKSSNENGTG